VPKRAVRRHHAERIVNKWKRIGKLVKSDYNEQELEMWAKLTSSCGMCPTGKGCRMCENPRISEGMTRKERAFYKDADQQERDIQFTEDD
jgi:hypothetical protein